MGWGSLYDILTMADSVARRRRDDITWRSYLLAMLLVLIAMALGVALVAVVFMLL